MPVPSSSEPYLSLKLAIQSDDPRFDDYEAYVHKVRAFQKLEVRSRNTACPCAPAPRPSRAVGRAQEDLWRPPKYIPLTLEHIMQALVALIVIVRPANPWTLMAKTFAKVRSIRFPIFTAFIISSAHFPVNRERSDSFTAILPNLLPTRFISFPRNP